MFAKALLTGRRSLDQAPEFHLQTRHGGVELPHCADHRGNPDFCAIGREAS